jgi:hypothetical protein
MNFLKKLFGGGPGGSGDDRGLYFYVRPKRCGEIVRVRIDPFSDMSQDDSGGYFVRKIAQATRCPFPAELTLFFDKSRRLTGQDITDGEFVSEADFEAWQTKEQQKL